MRPGGLGMNLYRTALAVFYGALIVTWLGPMTGCNRPSEENCKAAIENIRRIYGTDQNEFGKSPEAALRACRGNGTRKSVACVITAKTTGDLEKCAGPLVPPPNAPEK